MLQEDRDGGITILTLDNPARRNALGMPMRLALIDAFERAEADPAIRAVVLTGAGGAFCSGGDITGMVVDSLAAGRERFRVSHKLVRLMIKSAKPIVAAVEGPCVGAGLSLALCCDTIVAAENARFGAPFKNVGLIADFGLVHTLPARVGEGRARQILLYGELFGCDEAERIGLVDHRVAAGASLEAALARARTFLAGAPLPVAYTKAYLARGLEAALEWELEAQAVLLQTADHAEGRTAFLEKRKPAFAGR